METTEIEKTQKRSKKVSKWLGIKSGNITFDHDVECDIQEIRQLIDEAENDSTDNVSPKGGQA